LRVSVLVLGRRLVDDNWRRPGQGLLETGSAPALHLTHQRNGFSVRTVLGTAPAATQTIRVSNETVVAIAAVTLSQALGRPTAHGELQLSRVFSQK
jgi:hypothetical protein